MKRIVKTAAAGFIAAVLVVWLAACGTGAKNESGKQTGEDGAKTATGSGCSERTEGKHMEETRSTAAGTDTNSGSFVVGYIARGTETLGDRLLSKYAETKLNDLVKTGGIREFTGVLDGKDDPEEQIRLSRDCITKGCQYVFFVPAEAEASDPAVTEMEQAGVRVIVRGGTTASTKEAAWLYASVKEEQAGEALGQWIKEQCSDGGTVLRIRNLFSSVSYPEREDAVKRTVEETDGLTWAEAELVWRENLSAEEISAIWKPYEAAGTGRLVVLCDNEEICADMQRVCDEAGKEIICVGLKSLSGKAVSLVKEGTIRAAVYESEQAQFQTGYEAMIEALKTTGEVKTEAETEAGHLPYRTVEAVILTAEKLENIIKQSSATAG